MRRLVRSSRGQSMVEYAILIITAAAALMAMLAYVRAATMHRMKVGVDGIGHGVVYPP